MITHTSLTSVPNISAADIEFKETLDRLALSHLFHESISQYENSKAWWKPKTSKTHLDDLFGLEHEFENLPPRWWLERGDPESEKTSMSHIVFEDFIIRLNAVRCTHRRWKKFLGPFRRNFPSNFGIAGKEARVLMAYQSVQHLGAYMSQYGENDSKDLVDDLFQQFQTGGETNKWLLGLASKAKSQ